MHTDWKPEYLGQPRPHRNRAHDPNRSVTREAHESRQQDYDPALAAKGLSTAMIGAIRRPEEFDIRMFL